MGQAEIDGRKESFLQTVVDFADTLSQGLNTARDYRKFYITNGFNIGGAQEIDTAVTDVFYFTSAEFHQFHDLLVQIENFATGQPVNAGSAFRYRLFYEQLCASNFQVSPPATTDKILQSKYDHIQLCIQLAGVLDDATSKFDKKLGFHTSNQYGVAGDQEITDLFLDGKFRFLAVDYNNWINIAVQWGNFMNNVAVTPGFYEDVNTKVKSPDA